MSSAFPPPDDTLVDLLDLESDSDAKNIRRESRSNSKAVHSRARAHGVPPSVVKVGDVLRLAFIALYVISATASQIAGAALVVYLVNA